jgi:hypothetical protein
VVISQEQIDLEGAFQIRVTSVNGKLALRVLEYSKDRTQLFFVTPNLALDAHVLEDGDDIHLRFGPYTVESRGEMLQVKKDGGVAAVKPALSLWRAVERIESAMAA